MKNYRMRIACCAAALLCCAPLMQSCGKEESSAAQTAGSSADQSQAENANDDSDGSVTGTDSKPAGETAANGDTTDAEEDKLSIEGLKSEIKTSNSCARSIYNSLQAAIVDMETMDVDITWLKGRDFQYTGADFVFGETPKADASLEEKFRYRVYVYDTDITEMDNVAISFNDDCNVNCVALKRTEKKYDTEIYGTHPHQLTIDDFDSIKSMDDAVAFAKK